MEEAPVITPGHWVFRTLLERNIKSIKRQARRDIGLEIEQSWKREKVPEKAYTESEASSRLLKSSFYSSAVFFGLFFLFFSLLLSYFLLPITDITRERGVFVVYSKIIEKLPYIIVGALVICSSTYIGFIVHIIRRISRKVTETTPYEEKMSIFMQAVKLLLVQTILTLFIFSGMVVAFLSSVILLSKESDTFPLFFQIVAFAAILLFLLFEIAFGIHSVFLNPDIKKKDLRKRLPYLGYILLLSLLIASIVVCLALFCSIPLPNSNIQDQTTS